MFGKINITRIVKDHLTTLHANGSHEINWLDMVLFYFFPLVLSISLVCIFNITLAENGVGVLAGAMSVFAALLFNLLLLILDFLNKEKGVTQATSDKKSLISEIYYNISYTIFIAIVNVALLFICDITPKEAELVLRIESGLIFFLTTNFCLTLIMILKRMHFLLSYHISTQ